MESETTTQMPEMTRPREGRAIAGVAAALAIRFNLPVMLVRIIFVVLAFTGGLGLFLYAAGWLLIRSEDEPDTPAQRLLSQVGSWQGWLGIGLLAIAAVIVLDRIPFIRGDLLWAVALVVIGFLLYKGQLRIPASSRTDPNLTTGASTMTSTSPTAGGIGATPPILPATATVPARPSRPPEP
ncbi:MAG TPA: PspC domain-containing protein, partial [Acidimicrobiia bacterium]